MKVKYRLRLYKQVFLPMIAYGHEIWYPAIREKSTYLDRVNRLQRRVIRTILGAYRNASTARMLEIAEEIPLETLRWRGTRVECGEESCVNNSETRTR